MKSVYSLHPKASIELVTLLQSFLTFSVVTDGRGSFEESCGISRRKYLAKDTKKCNIISVASYGRYLRDFLLLSGM
jgi:hypothetical protein